MSRVRSPPTSPTRTGKRRSGKSVQLHDESAERPGARDDRNQPKARVKPAAASATSGAEIRGRRHDDRDDRQGLQPAGRDREAGRGERACRCQVVRHADPAQADEGADGAERRAGHPRHRDLAGPHPRLRCAGRRHLGQLVGRAGVRRLRHALWRLLRLALARSRPRHGVQDRLDGRRALPAGLVHGAAPAHRLALEPQPTPYRHDHRRPRPRDRAAAPAELPRDRARPSST